jgi:quercetin dioxygenase-like cupin family protein
MSYTLTLTNPGSDLELIVLQETKIKLTILGLIVAGSLVALPCAAQQVYSGDGHIMTTAPQLAWADAPSVAPGAKIAVIEGPLNKNVPFTFRLRLPANAKIAPHTHPAYERITVLSGTLHFAHGDTFDPGKTQPLGPGSFAIMPPGAPMFGYTREETVIQLHGMGPWGIAYRNLADDPRQAR